jgi:WD40 repeat protein
MHPPRPAVLLPGLVAAVVVAAGWLDVGPHPPSASAPSLAVATADEPAAHLDLYGDPLPPGVVTRLGTSRFRGFDRYCAVAFSPDGKTLAALGDEAEISLWDVASGKQIYWEPWPKREGGGDPLSSQFHTVLAFSPDGKTLLVGWDWIGSSRPICLWDVAERKERLRMEGARNGFHSAVVSADFRTLAVAATDGQVGLWDVASGKPRAGWSVPEIKAQLVALSPDSSTLATGGEDRTIRLWDTTSGKEIHTFPARERSIAALAFSPNGRKLACEDHDENIVLFGLGEGAGERRWDAGYWGIRTESEYDRSPFHPLAFSPDGRTLVRWDHDCTLNLWDVVSGERRRALPGDPVRCCCFSRDGKTLAAAGNRFLVLWDAASGEPLYPAHDFAVSQIRFSPDGRDVITLAGNKVRRWDAASGKLTHLMWTRPEAVLSVDGRTAIARDQGGWGETAFYDTVSNEEPLCCLLGDAAGQLLALSPDNRTLAVGRRQGAEDLLMLVDLGAGGAPGLAGPRPPGLDRGVLITLDGVIGTPRRLGNFHPYQDKTLFSPDGRTLAVAGPVPAPPDPNEDTRRNPFREQKEEDQRCRLWDVASGRLRREFTPGRDSLWGGGIAFSPDGRLLALRDCRGTVHLWETATGQEVRHWETKGVAALAFSPDGRTLAASDWPGGPIVPMGNDWGTFGPVVSL